MLNLNILFVVLNVCVPLGFWYFFYKKDRTPVPMRAVILTFFVGCFSVVPLLLYQEIFNRYVGDLSPTAFVQYFHAHLAWQGFLSFMSAILFLAAFITVLTGLMTIIFRFFYKQSFKKVFSALILEATNFTAFGMIIAVIIVIQFAISSFLGQSLVTSTIGLFLVLAVMEEYVKHLIVRLSDDHLIRDIDDAIEMSIIVGLSFGIVENIVYFFVYHDQELSLIVGRSVISLFAHVLYSGLFGFYYGTAHFAKYIYFLRARVSGEIFRLPQIIQKFLYLKGSVTYYEQKMMEGLVLATAVHTVFNLLLEYNLTFVITPFLLGGFFLLNYLLSHKENQKQYGLIGSRTMPYSDFQRLTWKISALRWAKQIKEEREKGALASLKTMAPPSGRLRGSG